MNRKAGLISLIGFLIIIGLVSAEAQFPGGGRGGGRGGGGMGMRPQMPEEMRYKMEALRAFPVEAIWAGLSFGIDLPDSQLIIIKPVIAEAWAKRSSVLTSADDADDWEEAKDTLKRLKKDVDKVLEVLITKDQRKKLKKLLKQQTKIAKFGRQR